MKKWLTIAAIVVASSVAGFTIYQQRNGASATAVVVPSAVLGDAQAASPTPSPSPLATTLPEFSLQNRAGEMQSIRSWPGKSKIVNFWATWCGPCRKEIPFLKEIAQTEAAAGFQVVGIAIDFRDDVLKYADEIKIDYPLLMGEQEGFAAAEAFGVHSMGLPFTAFTDDKDRIVIMLLGELTRPKAKIILSAVKRVNKGQLTPEAARAAITTEILKLPPTSH
jgi:thiol-disulfide isomerase/thioredoxin